ncbi:MAG: hypothetical protein QNJ98_02670 [Planctomycetota bacterium]|nr:hypothetical protein [Planctomycetota bacterium]
MTTRRTWTMVACFVMAGLLVGTGAAFAEDDPLAAPPADDGAPAPPSGEAKAPPPKDDAKQPDAKDAKKDGTPAMPTVDPKPKAPAKPDGWDTPDASPTTSALNDLLPPPLVRNPATGATTGGSRAASAREAPVATPPILPPDPTLPVLPDDGIDPALIPGVPRTPAPSGGTLRAAPPAGATIATVTKVHNVQLRDGTAALRLDVEFSASGQQGRALFLAAGFARADTNATIRSLVPAFAGRSGNIVSRTAPVRVQADGRYRASLWVPYGAFPAPGAGSSYNVRALVQLLRQEQGGRETVMSHQDTTFTVHGPAAR